jgi:hypothetical protein
MNIPRVIGIAFALLSSTLLAEEVTLRQSTMLKAERSAISLKAGTVVELMAREGDTITIKYKDFTGKIPASKLEEPKAAAKPAEPKLRENQPAPPADRPPQTNYGKAVQKAKDNAKAHDKNIVKPTEEILN